MSPQSIQRTWLIRMNSFNIGHHFYADDFKLLTSMSHRLKLCLEHLGGWCSFRRFQLIQDKTEIIWFGFKSKLANLKQVDTNLNICSVVIQPTDFVRNLGFKLDSELSMRQHVACVSSVRCSTRCHDNDFFLQSSYHASTSAT